MERLLALADPQIILLVAAIAVSILAFRLLVQILTAGWGLILAIAVIVLGVNYFFSITPQQLWLEMVHLPQDLVRLVHQVPWPHVGVFPCL